MSLESVCRRLTQKLSIDRCSELSTHTYYSNQRDRKILLSLLSKTNAQGYGYHFQVRSYTAGLEVSHSPLEHRMLVLRPQPDHIEVGQLSAIGVSPVGIIKGDHLRLNPRTNWRPAATSTFVYHDINKSPHQALSVYNKYQRDYLADPALELNHFHHQSDNSLKYPIGTFGRDLLRATRYYLQSVFDMLIPKSCPRITGNVAELTESLFAIQHAFTARDSVHVKYCLDLGPDYAYVNSTHMGAQQIYHEVLRQRPLTATQPMQVTFMLSKAVGSDIDTMQLLSIKHQLRLLGFKDLACRIQL